MISVPAIKSLAQQECGRLSYQSLIDVLWKTPTDRLIEHCCIW